MRCGARIGLYEKMSLRRNKRRGETTTHIRERREFCVHAWVWGKLFGWFFFFLYSVRRHARVAWRAHLVSREEPRPWWEALVSSQRWGGC